MYGSVKLIIFNFSVFFLKAGVSFQHLRAIISFSTCHFSYSK